jgi:hypothetical protein
MSPLTTRRRLLTLEWRPVDLLVLAVYSPAIALVMPRTTSLASWWLAAGFTSATYLVLAWLIRQRAPLTADPSALRAVSRPLLTRTILWTGRILGLGAVISTVRGTSLTAADFLTGAHLQRWDVYPVAMTLGFWLVYLCLGTILALASWTFTNTPAILLRQPKTKRSAARRALLHHFS